MKIEYEVKQQGEALIIRAFGKTYSIINQGFEVGVNGKEVKVVWFNEKNAYDSVSTNGFEVERLFENEEALKKVREAYSIVKGE